MKEMIHKSKEKSVGADASVRPFFREISKGGKGITLIALIITIIVMLILVGVTVSFTIGENGILNQTKEAKKEYEIGQVKEIFASNYSLEYYQKTGCWPSDEAITKIAEASIETGVDVNKFIVYHDKYAIAQNEANKDDANYEKMKEEFVFYDWNKVTLEEMEKLEVEYIPSQAESDTLCNLTNRCFSIDADGDGYLNLEDSDEIIKVANAAEVNFEQERYDVLAKLCFDSDRNKTFYEIIEENMWPNFQITEGMMFLWNIIFDVEGYEDQLGYLTDASSAINMEKIYVAQISFNDVLDNHIYYNSGRVPLEQEVIE